MNDTSTEDDAMWLEEEKAEAEGEKGACACCGRNDVIALIRRAVSLFLFPSCLSGSPQNPKYQTERHAIFSHRPNISGLYQI